MNVKQRNSPREHSSRDKETAEKLLKSTIIPDVVVANLNVISHISNAEYKDVLVYHVTLRQNEAVKISKFHFVVFLTRESFEIS